jgi:glycosyltransferase involved in cell wall biosynthesis
MRTAVVHDWLTTFAGAEHALSAILESVPRPELFTLISSFNPEELRRLGVSEVRTSFLQKIPKVEVLYRHLLPIMPLAVEQFELEGYELIISSSHAVAKGVLKRPEQLHICYCYTPMRYAWDLYHQYMASLSFPLKQFASLFLHYIRLWDLSSASRVDHFVAISKHVARRVWNTYRRRASVIYPPVDVGNFRVNYDRREDFFLCVSRNVPYKGLEILVDSFRRMPSKRLVLIGKGTEKIRTKSPNIQALGHVDRDTLTEYMEQARAFIYVAEEDFGISMVEALACGTPVVAYRRGGAQEIVQDQKNGLLFSEQNPESVIRAVERFEEIENTLDRDYIRKSAERFSRKRFIKQFSEFVNRKLTSHRLLYNRV